MHLANQGSGVFAIEQVETTELHFPMTESSASGFTVDMNGAVAKVKRKR